MQPDGYFDERVAAEYDTYTDREEFAAEDLTIAIDETPVGTFVEIEGGEAAILNMAQALGRTPDDFILDSYRGLFLGRRHQFALTGSDMVFADEWSQPLS